MKTALRLLSPWILPGLVILGLPISAIGDPAREPSGAAAAVDQQRSINIVETTSASFPSSPDIAYQIKTHIAIVNDSINLDSLSRSLAYANLILNKCGIAITQSAISFLDASLHYDTVTPALAPDISEQFKTRSHTTVLITFVNQLYQDEESDLQTPDRRLKGGSYSAEQARAFPPHQRSVRNSVFIAATATHSNVVLAHELTHVLKNDASCQPGPDYGECDRRRHVYLDPTNYMHHTASVPNIDVDQQCSALRASDLVAPIGQ